MPTPSAWTTRAASILQAERAAHMPFTGSSRQLADANRAANARDRMTRQAPGTPEAPRTATDVIMGAGITDTMIRALWRGGYEIRPIEAEAATPPTATAAEDVDWDAMQRAYGNATGGQHVPPDWLWEKVRAEYARLAASKEERP